MVESGSLLKSDWLRTPEGQETLQCLMDRKGLRMKTFGILEQPVFPTKLGHEEVNYKLMVVGKSGVGKTSTVAKLAGYKPLAGIGDTPGLQTTIIYWPTKIIYLNKVIVFRLTLWDVGDTALRKFDHLLPACTDKVDGILFLFSFIDKSSFDEIPELMKRYANPNDNFCKIVIGTKFDQYAHSEVTHKELQSFSNNWKIPILKIKNVPEYHPSDSRNEMTDVIPILNTVCEQLWNKDLKVAEMPEKKYESVPNASYF